jgi:predicted DsbA family dithiol-disulfide isomerase
MSSQTPKKIRIDVISDNVCPWCFVGKRKMEQAIQRTPGVEFEGMACHCAQCSAFLTQFDLVAWKPFYLNPNIAPEGEDLREHLTSKYGEAMVKRFDAPNNPLSNAGRAVGINFNQKRRVGTSYFLMIHFLHVFPTALFSEYSRQPSSSGLV